MSKKPKTPIEEAVTADEVWDHEADTIDEKRRVVPAPPHDLEARRRTQNAIVVAATIEGLHVDENDHGRSVDGQARNHPSSHDGAPRIARVDGRDERGLDADDIVRRASLPQVAEPRIPGKKPGKYPGYPTHNNRRVPRERSLTKHGSKG